MTAAREITAEEVLEAEPVTAQSDESLSQVKNRMEKNSMRAIPVVNSKNQLQGAVGYRDLIRFIQFNPAQTSLDKVMHQPPRFELTDSLMELADLRINSGRKMLVITDNHDHLEGVIGDQQFLEAFQEAEEFEDVTTMDLGESEVLTVFEEDTLEEARHMLLDNNVSRLPVIDSDGNLTGVIDSIDMLKTMVPRESPDPGGTAGDRHGTEEITISGGNEKEGMSHITVEELMDRTPNTSEEHLRGTAALKLMHREERTDLVITDDSYPEYIVTLKDFTSYLAGFSEPDTVLVQLTGLEVPEEKAAIHDKIKKQLQGSLGRKLRKPEELTLRIKKAEKDGKKHRYELDLTLYSEFGITKINEEGWELLDTVDEVLNELNRVIRKKHEKRTEHR